MTLQEAHDEAAVICTMGGGEEAHMRRDSMAEEILRDIARGDLPPGVAVAMARYAVTVDDTITNVWYG